MTLGVLCEDPALAGAIGRLEGVDEIYCAAAPAGRRARWIQTLPYITRTAADLRPGGKNISGFPVPDPDAAGFLVRGLDGLEYILESGTDREVIADAALYTMNKRAALHLLDNGVSRLTLPYEIDRKSMISRGEAEHSCLVLYGRIPLMISAQCYFKNSGLKCRAPDKGKGEDITFLRDRKGVSFPVKRFCAECTNVIYNSVPLSLHRDIKAVMAFAPSSVRLDLTTEPEKEAMKIVKYYVNLIRRAASGEDLKELTEAPPFCAYTRGHFGKGVL
ncbi:MAG: hypothetical protein K5985_07205 [Lachnospiraceae bacterium]|nr:hypothetical protein [Lachnospiraceae bacterium]